jgi:hypothetical protein
VIKGSRLGSHACIIAELNYLRSNVGERVRGHLLNFANPHAALRDLGFSGKGGMKTQLSQGRTARLRAAVDRYQAIDFDEPLQKRVKKTASKCAPQSRMPRPSHGLPHIARV